MNIINTTYQNLITPGEILNEEFLKPLNLTQNHLAQAIQVPRSRVSRIIAGKCAITADTAMRLAEFFGNSAQFWLNLQNHYDLQNIKNLNWQEIKKHIQNHRAISDSKK